ncbi:MAG: hypothetical protein ACREUR_10360 [Nitrosospira sp.]
MNDKQALEFPQLLADTARAIALKHFRTPLDTRRKADENPVTIVDEKSKAHFPYPVENLKLAACSHR